MEKTKELEAFIKEHFSYDPETGKVTREKPTVRSNGRPHAQGVGRPAGWKSMGYIRIKTPFGEAQAHRVAWFLHYGSWPKDQIDHINGIRDDNRINNLRDVNNRENQLNRKKSTGKSKHLPVGIYEIERKGRSGKWYAARVECCGKTYSTYRRSLSDASAYRQEKFEKLKEVFNVR